MDEQLGGGVGSEGWWLWGGVLVVSLMTTILGVSWWKNGLIRSNQNSKPPPPQPPGPWRWPLVGCLPSVGFKHRHRTFYELSKKYGPVMRVPIGSVNLVVLHGPAMAQELLSAQDAHFCSRPLSMTGQYLGFDHLDLNLSPFNANWRAVRKAFTAHLFSPPSLALHSKNTAQELACLLQSIYRWMNDHHPKHNNEHALVNVTHLTNQLITNLIIKMLFGNRYLLDSNAQYTSILNNCGHSMPTNIKSPCENNPSHTTIAFELQNFFEDYLREGIFLWGELNVSDFFPWIARWDFQGLEARFKRLRFRLEKLFNLIIEDHHYEPKKNGYHDNYITTLISENQLSKKQIMGIMSNALIAGIDTTARAIEWAMAELNSYKDVILKAQHELDIVVGKERIMNEKDIGNLVYLQAIAKEVLRLHPSAPLDDPHLNENDSTLGGYHIPANSIVLHNLWALGQDPSIWDDPTTFTPERFLLTPQTTSLNVHGNHYQLLPFSSGRRKCPAFLYATQTLQHVVGVFLQAFDWHSTGSINMDESDGIVVGLKHPLMLSVKPRLESKCYDAYA